MKRIALLLVIVSIISCTKEKESNSIVGSWNLTQINSGNTSSVYLSGTELSVEFKSDSSFTILGPKSNYTFLRDYDKYIIVSNNRIRFFNAVSNEELFAEFYVNNTLSLSYEVRCPYEEKFIRR